ncbi:MAG TPA: sigma-70 family RNA polymerase sigma factor [Solirubrobacteraceae bacterium]|nr:sigma-70 family RNA polymerase sigma factor [Solirubrobacteraceae bacterium]
MALVASIAVGVESGEVTPPRERRKQDRRAVRALRDRAPEAMALVMEAYGRTVLGYLTQLLGDRATAEDVLQQVLLEVWQRGASYDPERAGLLTWVLTIARSRGIDELRRRVPEPIDPAGLTTQAEASAPLEAETDRLLEQWRMAGLLSRLPREEASLLRLRFYDGLSQSEIAAQTGIALGTVKARMVKGLCQLREMLEAEETMGVAS